MQVSVTYQHSTLQRPDMALLQYGFLPPPKPPLLAVHDLPPGGASWAQVAALRTGLAPSLPDDSALGAQQAAPSCSAPCPCRKPQFALRNRFHPMLFTTIWWSRFVFFIFIPLRFAVEIKRNRNNASSVEKRLYRHSVTLH